MIESADSKTIRYLPIELLGQSFAIPASYVISVHQVHDATPSQTGKESESHIKVVDLGFLFWNAMRPQRHAHIVVTSTSVGICSLKVDAVFPIHIATPGEYHSLPRLIEAMGVPFIGTVHGAEGLVLVIDMNRIAECLRRAIPDLVTEPPDVS